MAEVSIDEVSKQIRDLFNRGFRAFESGNLDYAIDMLYECVIKEPRLLRARKFLRAAEVQKHKGKKSNVMSKMFSSATGMLKGMKGGKSGDPYAAVEGAEKLLKNDPLNPDFVKVFVKAALAADLPEAAVQTLEVTRDFHTTNISIINMLGSLYQKLGRTSSARECFEQLCELCPNDPDALKMLKDAMAIDSMTSDNWEKNVEEGKSFHGILKDKDEAVLLEQEKKAVKGEKDTDALVGEYLKKIEAEPENINYYRHVAKLYAQQNNFEDAVSFLAKAQELAPGDPEIDNTLSATQIHKFNYEVEQLEQAGETQQAEEKRFAKVQFMFDDMQERVQRYPNDLKLRFEWGVLLFDNDYVNESIQQFQLSQRSPKHRIKTLYYLAMCFKHKEQYDMALGQLETAASELHTMDDTKKNVLYELGEICEILKDNEKAAGFYKQIYQIDIGYKDISERVERTYKKE